MNTLPFTVALFLLGLYYVVTYPTVEAFTERDCADILVQEGSTFALYKSSDKTKSGNKPKAGYQPKAGHKTKAPIIFKSLDEYIQFTEWQRQQGVMCPILYLQQAEDVQNNLVYKIRPSPTNMQGGLPDLPKKELGQVLGSGSGSGSGSVQGYDNISASLVLPRPSTKTVVDKVYTGKELLIDAGRDDAPFNVNSYPGFDGHNQDVGRDTPLDKMFSDDSPVSANPMDENWGGAKCTATLVEQGYYKDNEVSRNTGSWGGLQPVSARGVSASALSTSARAISVPPASDRSAAEKRK